MMASELTVDLRSLRILLAEDSPLHQRLAVRILESQGHCVTLVRNGREVLEAIGRQPFDVILMDIEMPEIDGLTVTRLIRDCEDDDQPHLPIVAVTSNENPEECLEAGMDAYLTKPLHAGLLRRTLKFIVDRDAA